MKDSFNEKTAENPGKEDRLGPTSVDQGKTQQKDANLSHDELNERLDLYSQVGQELDQFFEFQKMKQNYNKEVDDDNKNRIQADIHYAQGVRAGLPHTDHQTIKEMQERSDQQKRNEVAREAKEQYMENNSLTKTFSENVPSLEEMRKKYERENPEKGMDRER